MNELYNIEELKILNGDLQAQNSELHSQYGTYSLILPTKYLCFIHFYFLDYLNIKTILKFIKRMKKSLTKKL